MNDPLTRALDDAPQVRTEAAHHDVTSYPTDHAPPLGPVLERLRQQLTEALSLPFFDGGASIDVTPVTKRALAEAGSATIVARRREPAYEATVALDVRSDHAHADEDQTGRYQVAVRAHLRCEDVRGRAERHVEVTVREIDGTLELDVPHLRAEMAAAIHAMGKAAGDAS